MTCYNGFGNLSDGQHVFWTGDFNGNGITEVLFNYRGDKNWWLAGASGAQLNWSFAGNTSGFGDVADGRPLWVGRFSASNKDQLLFYYPGDDNWFLGSYDGSQFQWSFAGNTAGFGHAINDGRPFWVADFDGDGRSEVLFYYPGDDNWWLGKHDGTTLVWRLVGNTHGFGHGINDGRPFWIGNFSRTDRAEVLFYYPGDDNWWLGTFDGNQINWTFAGNTAGFGHGINDGRPFWIGDFNGNGRSDVLFYYPGDDNWWLGSHDGNQLVWSFAGNTSGFGHAINDGRPFWTGRFRPVGKDQMLFYFPGDRNWWLGMHNGTQLVWNLEGNTDGFGQVWDGRPFWIGNFKRRDEASVLFYFPGDGNWWLGTDDGRQLAWTFAGNTGRPCRESVIVHFKSLLPITSTVESFIDTQFLAMEDLYGQGSIAVYRGTTEDLSGVAALQTLLNLNVGACTMGTTTTDQNTLYANRNNAGADDLVVYIVSTLIGGAGNFVGCAAHPSGQPGAAVVQVSSTAQWLVAHELGHVLGLSHVDSTVPTNSDFLMWPTIGWTNVPPDLSSGEYNTMLASTYSRPC